MSYRCFLDIAAGSPTTPSQIPDRATASRLADDYMFFGCIRFIFEMKTGPFHEHSRMLYDISAVAEWGKVRALRNLIPSRLSFFSGNYDAWCLELA